jgi:hypothetical protein
MKINELLENAELTEKQIRNAAINILAYIYGNDKWDTYDESIQLLLKTQFKYTGPMFRGISASPETIVNAKSMVDLVADLHNYNSTDYVSWSKSIQGMDNALFNNIHTGEFEYGSVPCFYIYQQVSEGVDACAIAQSYPQFDTEGLLELVIPEEEVLARMDTSKMELIGFWYNENVYPLNRIHDLINQITS